LRENLKRRNIKWEFHCSKDTAPLIHDSGTRRRQVVSFKLWPLYIRGKKPQIYLIE
jgi:hypothetical protein